MDAAPRCDAIIVNFNAGNLLQDCVHSVLREGLHRCVVVDNASTDGSVASLEREVPDDRIRILRNTRNLGFAAACNQGIRVSDAPYLLFLNPDSVLAPGCAQSLLRAMQTDSRIGMAGGFLASPDGSEQRGGRRRFPTPANSILRAFGLARFARQMPARLADFDLHHDALPEGPVPVEAVSGACMLVRRSAIDDVGPWDEGYFLHCEDLDWCMRFHLRGWGVLFVPDARVLHAGGASSRDRPLFVEWHKHRGMLRFHRKFLRGRTPVSVGLLVVIGIWLRLGLVSIRLGAQSLWFRLGSRGR